MHNHNQITTISQTSIKINVTLYIFFPLMYRKNIHQNIAALKFFTSNIFLENVSKLNLN